jgi:hypothetical protein
MSDHEAAMWSGALDFVSANISNTVFRRNRARTLLPSAVLHGSLLMCCDLAPLAQYGDMRILVGLVYPVPPIFYNCTFSDNGPPSGVQRLEELSAHFALHGAVQGGSVSIVGDSAPNINVTPLFVNCTFSGAAFGAILSAIVRKPAPHVPAHVRQAVSRSVSQAARPALSTALSETHV